MKYSVILPIYKQSKHLKDILRSYTYGLKKLGHSYEIVLVVNGNDTSSLSVAKEIARNDLHIKVIFLREAGWGKAVIAGIKESKGEFICYTNSARTKVPDLITILNYAHSNSQAVIKASRILRIGFLRILGSTLYNIECRLLLNVPVWDINGTPKVLPASVLSKIKLTSHDDLIDAELIARCVQMRLPILEVPIVFSTRFGGKSTTNFLSALKMYFGVLKLRKLIH